MNDINWNISAQEAVVNQATWTDIFAFTFCENEIASIKKCQDYVYIKLEY